MLVRTQRPLDLGAMTCVEQQSGNGNCAYGHIHTYIHIVHTYKKQTYVHTYMHTYIRIYIHIIYTSEGSYFHTARIYTYKTSMCV